MNLPLKMVIFFLKIVLCINTVLVPSEEQVYSNFIEQVYNMINKDLNRKNYFLCNFELDTAFTLISVSKHRVNINFRNVYFNTAEDFTFTPTFDGNYISDDNLYFIVKKFGLMNISYVNVYIENDNYNLLLDQEYNVTFIARLNILSQKLKGPVFIYKFIVKDFGDVEKIYKNNRKNKKELGYDDVYPKIFAQFIIDKKSEYAFFLYLQNFDLSLILKRTLFSKYNDNWIHVYNFLSHFSCNDFKYFRDLIYFCVGEYEKMISKENFFILFCVKHKEIAQFFLNFTSIANETKEQYNQQYILDLEIIEECNNIITKIKNMSNGHLKKIIIFMYSIYKKPLFRMLIRRILDSDLNGKKVYLLKILLFKEILNEDEINWFTAYRYSSRDVVFNLMNDFYMQKIVDIFSKEFFGVINMFSCLILYFEFEDYLNQCHEDLNVQCEFYKDFINVRKILQKDLIFKEEFQMAQVIQTYLYLVDKFFDVKIFFSGVFKDAYNYLIPICNDIKNLKSLSSSEKLKYLDFKKITEKLKSIKNK